MKFIIGLKETKAAVISRMVGPVKANSPEDAKVGARLPFAGDTLVDSASAGMEAMMMQTLHLMSQGGYIAVKKVPEKKTRNEGAISKDAGWVYVNGIRDKDLHRRMLDLQDALPQFKIEDNDNEDKVMGVGSGTNYGIFVRFKKYDDAVKYIKELGFDVVVVENAGFPDR